MKIEKYDSNLSQFWFSMDSISEKPETKMLNQLDYYPNGPGTRLESSIITFVLGVIAICLNTLAIISISRIRTALPGKIRLVCCLACFDFLVSCQMVIEASFAFAYYADAFNVRNISEITGKNISMSLPSYHPCFAIFMHTLRYTGYNGILLTLVALSTDLYIAIIEPFNHSQLMRHSRISLVITAIVVLSIAFGFSELYLPIPNEIIRKNLPDSHNIKIFENYCFLRWHNQWKSSFATFGVIVISIVIVSTVYLRVFCEIKRFHKQHYHKRCLSNHNNSPNIPIQLTHNHNIQLTNRKQTIRMSSNASTRRNQKGLAITLILLIAFLITFLPSFIFEFYFYIEIFQTRVTSRYRVFLFKFFVNLPLVCTVLDPILYSYRLKDVKKSAIEFILSITFLSKKTSHKNKMPPLPKKRQPKRATKKKSSKFTSPTLVNINPVTIHSNYYTAMKPITTSRGSNNGSTEQSTHFTPIPSQNDLIWPNNDILHKQTHIAQHNNNKNTSSINKNDNSNSNPNSRSNSAMNTNYRPKKFSYDSRVDSYLNHRNRLYNHNNTAGSHVQSSRASQTSSGCSRGYSYSIDSFNTTITDLSRSLSNNNDTTNNNTTASTINNNHTVDTIKINQSDPLHTQRCIFSNYIGRNFTNRNALNDIMMEYDDDVDTDDVDTDNVHQAKLKFERDVINNEDN